MIQTVYLLTYIIVRYRGRIIVIIECNDTYSPLSYLFFVFFMHHYEKSSQHRLQPETVPI